MIREYVCLACNIAVAVGTLILAAVAVLTYLR